MQETLRLIFRNTEGRLATLNVPDPRSGITETDITTCMDSIITANMFETTGGDITEKVRAEIVSRSVDVVYENA